MLGKDIHDAATSRLESELSEGWLEYRRALESIEQSDWSRALVLLAEAETIFRVLDDQDGLWRALIGQALLHWRDGMAALAIARAMAAMRRAEAVDDGFAVGCVAWQLANMHLSQGEYSRAANFLDQAQLALDALGMAPPGGALAAAARLCTEIARWRQMRERQQIGQREAESAIAEIQRDLIARLNQAAASARAAPASGPEVAHAMHFLLPDPHALLALPASTTPRKGLGAWLTRLWRRLLHRADTPAVEGLTRVSHIAAPYEEIPEEPGGDLSVAEPDSICADAPAIEVQALALVTDPRASANVEPPATAPRLWLDPAPQPVSTQAAGRVGLAVYCFGAFRVLFNDVPIDRWESARGRTIFKYLIARHGAAAPKEQLADMFWPDSEPELARRSLHQAIYCLRQTFKRLAPDVPIVQFADGHYQISRDVLIWVDTEEFSQTIEQARALLAAGQAEQAMQAYAVAVDLYVAPFLAEDRYEEWTEEPRRSYQAMYLEALHQLARHHYERGEHPAAILLCQRALAEESCDEETHQLLIACYVAQGLRHLAVRQYQICANALKTELGLTPSEEFEAFYRRVVAMG
jgi:DNA-binding SARP family transcriptional activator